MQHWDSSIPVQTGLSVENTGRFSFCLLLLSSLIRLWSLTPAAANFGFKWRPFLSHHCLFNLRRVFRCYNLRRKTCFFSTSACFGFLFLVLSQFGKYSQPTATLAADLTWKVSQLKERPLHQLQFGVIWHFGQFQTWSRQLWRPERLSAALEPTTHFRYPGRKEVAIGAHPKRPFVSILELNQFQSHANTDELAWW